jgi:hypothetical protein
MSPAGCSRVSCCSARRDVASLLWQADCDWDTLRVAEEVVDAADEVAVEVTDGFLLGLPVGALAGDLDGGARVVAHA